MLIVRSNSWRRSVHACDEVVPGARHPPQLGEAHDAQHAEEAQQHAAAAARAKVKKVGTMARKSMIAGKLKA